MSEPRSSFGSKMYSFLPKVEKVLLGVAAIALILRYQGINADEILKISLAGLAGVFYLMGFMRPPKAETDNSAQTAEEKKGFTELLFATILPKIAWISCSISTIGILFALLLLAGSREMLTIGASASAMATILVAVGLAQGNEKVKAISDVLYRMVPLLGISVWFLTR